MTNVHLSSLTNKFRISCFLAGCMLMVLFLVVHVYDSQSDTSTGIKIFLIACQVVPILCIVLHDLGMMDRERISKWT